MSVTDSAAAVPPGVALRTRPARASRQALVTAPRLAWTAMFVLIAAATGTVLCSESTPALSPGSVRLAVPPALVGPLGGLGPDIHLGGAIVLFTLMCLAYGTLVRLGVELPARVVVGGVIVLHVLMALAPSLLSTRRVQLWRVRADGRALSLQSLRLRTARGSRRGPRLVPVRRRFMGDHPNRLWTGVHGGQLPARPPEHRHRDARLQADDGRRQPRGDRRRRRLRTAPGSRSGTGVAVRRSEPGADHLRGRWRPQRHAHARRARLGARRAGRPPRAHRRRPARPRHRGQAHRGDPAAVRTRRPPRARSPTPGPGARRRRGRAARRRGL